MEQETQTWRKVLRILSTLCLVVVFVSLSLSLWLEEPAHVLPFEPRWISHIAYGIYFTLQGILNWREHRKLAIFELGAVAFVLVVTAYFILIR